MGEEVLVEAQRDYLAARMGMDLDREAHRLIGSSYGVGELGLNLLFETRETIRIRRAMRRLPELAHLLTSTNAHHTPPCVFCFNPMRCLVEVLAPDADGFGELCITLLNPHALIALPRYATGDLGRLINRHEARLAAQLSGSACPWLPLVVLKGRLKDRPAGLPSVEHIKTLLYTDPWVADQLTGAFRLTHRALGQAPAQAHLSVQAGSKVAALSPELYAQLRLLMHRFFAAPMSLEISAPEDFPFRPVLDFERKFSYVD
jgi:phenylacetate-CoA ligase